MMFIDIPSLCSFSFGRNLFLSVFTSGMKKESFFSSGDTKVKFEGFLFEDVPFSARHTEYNTEYQLMARDV